MIKQKINVPNKLAEITLGQYQKFSKIYTKEIDQDFLQKKMIEIFCGIPIADVDKIKYIDIAENTKAQNEYEIVVVPTIVVFKDGEEMKRFQADISFAIKATRKEIQEYIDELLMEDY